MITIKNIKAIQNHILFQFIDGTAGGVFTPKQEGKIISVSSLKDQKAPRIGKVLLVGPSVNKQINVGDYILIESGMWTKQIWLGDGMKVWKTDDTKVIASSSDEGIS